MTKIIFFDIDGTLIDFGKGAPSPRVVETLNRLQQNGIRICLATGRCPIIIPDMGGVQFDACLAFNGSLCFRGDEVIHSNPLLAEDVQTIIENGRRMKRPVSLATRDRIVANGNGGDLAEYYRVVKLELKETPDFDQVIHQPVYQFMVAARPEEYDQLIAGTRNAKIVAWWDRAVDIIPGNGDKGVGIRKILEYFHIDPKDAMAFGDGGNDIEMLQAVGTGVAMGNAGDKVKAAARQVCASVSEDGVYSYCLEHGLI